MTLKSEKTAHNITSYADRFRLYSTVFLAFVFLCIITLFVYVFFKEDRVINKLIFGVLTLTALYAFTKYEYINLRAYLPKASFNDKGIECTIIGKPLKKMLWDDVKEIVCIEYERFGTSGSATKYLMFAGHELAQEEKAKSIELAGLRNDIIVVKYNDKLIKCIKNFYDFTFKDESGRKKHN